MPWTVFVPELIVSSTFWEAAVKDWTSPEPLKPLTAVSSELTALSMLLTTLVMVAKSRLTGEARLMVASATAPVARERREAAARNFMLTE